MVASEFKSEWTVSGSSTFNDHSSALVSNTIDGNYRKVYMSEYRFRAWVQIDLKASHHIQAVRLIGKYKKMY